MRFAIQKDTRMVVGGISVNAKANGTIIESDERLDRLNPFFRLLDEENTVHTPQRKSVKRFSDISK